MTTNRQLPYWLRCVLRRGLGLRVLRGHDVPLSRSITFKDLFAITAAVNTRAASLACRNILFHCDNLSIVHILTSGTRNARKLLPFSVSCFTSALITILWSSTLMALIIISLTLYLVFRSTSSLPPVLWLPVLQRLQDLYPWPASSERA